LRSLTSTIFPYTTLFRSTTVTTGPGIPMPFVFYYDGYMVDRIGISVGGWISLGNSFLTPPGPSVDMTSSGTNDILNSTTANPNRSKEHTSELQSRENLVC